MSKVYLSVLYPFSVTFEPTTTIPLGSDPVIYLASSFSKVK